MASDRHHWYLLRVLNDERQAQADKRAWRATIGPAQPKPSTASRSVPWSLAAQKSWTACSPGGTPMRSYSDSYSATKGHDSRWVVMASDLVGRTGFEPVTSSVSGKSRPVPGICHRRTESNGEPFTCEKLLGGSRWVRGRLIASALIRGSHRPSAARSARVDQERVTLCARPRRRRPPRRQRHQAPRRVRPRPDTARHDPRRARRGRFDAEHHHGAALTSPSARPARSETRLRHWPGRSRPRRRRSAVLTGQGSSCRTGRYPPWHRHQLDLGRPAGLRDRQARPRGPQW